jgi:glycosyltransferase involved in cell wall biosynthesis
MQSINSVEKQNYPFMEHLIIDGGSTDGTSEIVSKLASITWQQSIGENQSESVNRGWRNAKGDLLGWLNSDDLYEPETFNIVAKFFEEDPKIDIIYGNCDFIDERGSYLGIYLARSFNLYDLVRNAINYIPQPTVFMRREVLESVGFLNESLDYCMDFDYWLRAGLSEKIVYLPIRLAKMRLHPQAKSNRKTEEFANELLGIYKEYFNKKDLPQDIKHIEKMSMCSAYTRAAHISFWSKNTSLSFNYSVKALRYRPFNLLPLSYLFASNKLFYFIASRLQKNPYKL